MRPVKANKRMRQLIYIMMVMALLSSCQQKGDKNMKTKTLDQIKTKYYGEIGTPERDRIERDLDALRIGLKIRTAREQKEMTQAQLADRIDKKRTFISKVENDGGNITLKTLFDIVERGLGGKLHIDVQL